MKYTATNLILAAAISLAASTTASAQGLLKADIPFAFEVSGTVMPPGTYLVKSYEAESRFQLSNLDKRRSVLALPVGGTDAPKAWRVADQPKLEFVSSGSGYVLSRIWTDNGAPAKFFAAPKKHAEEPTRIATVPLYSARAR